MTKMTKITKMSKMRKNPNKWLKRIFLYSSELLLSNYLEKHWKMLKKSINDQIDKSNKNNKNGQLSL